MSERCAVIGVGQTKHKAKRDDISIAGLVRDLTTVLRRAARTSLRRAA